MTWPFFNPWPWLSEHLLYPRNRELWLYKVLKYWLNARLNVLTHSVLTNPAWRWPAVTNEFTDVQRGYGTWLNSHSKQGAALGFYFIMAWPPNPFLFPWAAWRRKMMKEKWLKIHERQEGSSYSIRHQRLLERLRFFLFLISLTNHFNVQPDEKKLLWKFSMWPPPNTHTTPQKTQKTLLKNPLKWLKIFTEESFRWLHRQQTAKISPQSLILL